MALQLAQAEKWAEDYGKTREWVEVIEGHFSSWEFDKAEEGQPCGSVICVSSWGAVEVHDNLLRKQKLDKETSTALRAKTVVTYPASLCRYISMHKSVAVQLALLNNPRKAKELAVIQKIQNFKAHSCHKYFSQNETESATFSVVTGKINALYDLFQSHGFDQVKPDVIEFFRRDYETYDVVQKLSDEQLETSLLTLSALEYGLTVVDGMDCSNFSLFNRLGLDMGVQMDECWCPDEDFLKRRNKAQLQKIITEAGFSGQFASVAGYKKGELVKKLAKVFAKNFSENSKSAWLPEPMQFPAVNPDGMNLPEEREDLENDELDAEEYSEDDE
jgi:ParB family chromosome partitioning protein